MKKYLLTFATLFTVFSCSNEPVPGSLSAELAQKRGEKFQLVQKYGLDVLFSSHFSGGNTAQHSKPGQFRVLLNINHMNLKSPMIGPQPENAVVAAGPMYVFSNRPFPISTIMSYKAFSKLWIPGSSFSNISPNGHLTFFEENTGEFKHVSVQIHHVNYVAGQALLALEVSLLTGSDTFTLGENIENVTLFVDTFAEALTSSPEGSSKAQDPLVEVPKFVNQVIENANKLRKQLSPAFKSSFEGSLQFIGIVLKDLAPRIKQKVSDSKNAVAKILSKTSKTVDVGEAQSKIFEGITRLYQREICYHAEALLNPSNDIFTVLNNEVGGLFGDYKGKSAPWPDFVKSEELLWQKDDSNSVTIQVIEKIGKAIGVQVDKSCVAKSEMKEVFRKTTYFQGFSYLTFYLYQEIVKAKIGCSNFLTKCIK